MCQKRVRRATQTDGMKHPYSTQAESNAGRAGDCGGLYSVAWSHLVVCVSIQMLTLATLITCELSTSVIGTLSTRRTKLLNSR